jgi:NADH pyrophosphatase NudC (nudix superfamily)
VLDKIRAEIEEQKKERCFDDDDMFVYRKGLDDALYIIDKYKAEIEGNWDVSKTDNDGERELIDRAVKALEAEFATKTCNKQITSKLENAELERDSEETCNNKQVISKLVASEGERMTREEREDAIQFFARWQENRSIMQKYGKLAIEALEQEPKAGHWIIISPTNMYCSECHEIEHLDTSRRFCAYCGTRMSENPTGSESEEQNG